MGSERRMLSINRLQRKRVVGIQGAPVRRTCKLFVPWRRIIRSAAARPLVYDADDQFAPGLPDVPIRRIHVRGPPPICPLEGRQRWKAAR